MRRGELQTRSLQKVQEQILFYYLGSCSAVTVAISVLVDSATVLNSTPILSFQTQCEDGKILSCSNDDTNKEKIAELVTGIQFYWMDNDARILTRL
jgi:hypothetical protein